jgi:hypothetical protein
MLQRPLRVFRVQQDEKPSLKPARRHKNTARAKLQLCSTLGFTHVYGKDLLQQK